MDFGALPPEVNWCDAAGPARHHGRCGVGSGTVTAELSSAATGYETVITSALSSEGWLGPASAAMAEAVALYVAWMRCCGAAPSAAATQARGRGREAAFAATVPPPLIAANRVVDVQLISTVNAPGQNTGDRGRRSSVRRDVGAQDSAAGGAHCGVSALALAVTPFSTPPRSPTHLLRAAQAAAVAATRAWYRPVDAT